MTRRHASPLWITIVLCTVSPARAEYSYSLLDIPGYSASNAYGINNDGTILVSGLPQQDMLIRSSAGTYTPFQYPGATKTVGLGINNLGTVVGDVAIPGNSSFVGFIAAADGTTATFEYPAAGMQVNAINDPGAIVGLYSNGEDDRGSFIRAPDGTFQSLRYLDDPTTAAYGINNLGQITGQSSLGSFLREPDGSFVPIAYPGSVETQAFGINNFGVVTGLYVLNGTHGFVRYPDDTYLTLDFPGAQATHPWGINDQNEVAGIASFSGGHPVAFWATTASVPEPSTLVLLVIGVLAITRMSTIRCSVSD